MQRQKALAGRRAPGDTWNVLSLVYNYVDFRDLLVGLQVCKRLRRDLPQTTTQITATSMTQVGLTFIANTFTSLEQLVIDQELDSDLPANKYCVPNHEGNDDRLDGRRNWYDLHPFDQRLVLRRAYVLDFSKVRLPMLQRLAVKGSPLQTLALNTRNTPALTHLRLCSTEDRAGRGVRLNLPNLQQLHLEHVQLRTSSGLTKSLEDCSQLRSVVVRNLWGGATLNRTIELNLPACRHLALEMCSLAALKLWAPHLRLLSLSNNFFIGRPEISPQEGPAVVVNLTYTFPPRDAVQHLQSHPRVGRARVLGAVGTSWDALTAEQIVAHRKLEQNCREAPSKVTGEVQWEPLGWVQRAAAEEREDEDEEDEEDEEGEDGADGDGDPVGEGGMGSEEDADEGDEEDDSSGSEEEQELSYEFTDIYGDPPEPEDPVRKWLFPAFTEAADSERRRSAPPVPVAALAGQARAAPAPAGPGRVPLATVNGNVIGAARPGNSFGGFAPQQGPQLQMQQLSAAIRGPHVPAQDRQPQALRLPNGSALPSGASGPVPVLQGWVQPISALPTNLAVGPAHGAAGAAGPSGVLAAAPAGPFQPMAHGGRAAATFSSGGAGRSQLPALAQQPLWGPGAQQPAAAPRGPAALLYQMLTTVVDEAQGMDVDARTQMLQTDIMAMHQVQTHQLQQLQVLWQERLRQEQERHRQEQEQREQAHRYRAEAQRAAPALEAGSRQYQVMLASASGAASTISQGCKALLADMASSRTRLLEQRGSARLAPVQQPQGRACGGRRSASGAAQVPPLGGGHGTGMGGGLGCELERWMAQIEALASHADNLLGQLR